MVKHTTSSNILASNIIYLMNVLRLYHVLKAVTDLGLLGMSCSSWHVHMLLSALQSTVLWNAILLDPQNPSHSHYYSYCKDKLGLPKNFQLFQEQESNSVQICYFFCTHIRSIIVKLYINIILNCICHNHEKFKIKYYKVWHRD